MAGRIENFEWVSCGDFTYKDVLDRIKVDAVVDKKDVSISTALKILENLDLIDWVGDHGKVQHRDKHMSHSGEWRFKPSAYTFTTNENYFDDIELDRKLKKMTIDLTEKNVKNLDNILKEWTLNKILTYLGALSGLIGGLYSIVKIFGWI